MNRSIKKGPFAGTSPLEKIETQEGSEKRQVIKVWFRRSTIFPSFVGFIIAVYDGREHVLVYITEDMVGHKLGKFVLIRTLRGYKVVDKTTTTIGK